MPRAIEFVCIPCPEDEPFCFEVDAETFENLTGREPGYGEQGRRSGLYRVYPQQLAGAFRERKKVRVSLNVQPLT